MASKSVLNKPIVLESFEHELMLHAQVLAETNLYQGTFHDVVKIYRAKLNCLYLITDHGGAFTLNRIYTIDDEPLFSNSLKLAEARWPTDLTTHTCEDCLRMAPGLGRR